MNNYTIWTAALKATTIDTRVINTKNLKINGIPFEPSSIKTVTTTFGSGNYDNSSDCLWSISLGEDCYPISLYINGIEVICSKSISDNSTWAFEIFGQLDEDLTEIYGGIDDIS